MPQLVRFLAIGAALIALALPALAVEPDEMLEDPALEERARDLSAEIRCVVCQNQNIDDSNADLARELRILVRERIVAGDSDEEILDFLVARYGEFVLLRPRFNATTALLWGAPILLLLGGGYLAYRAVRHRSAAGSGDSARLTPEEEKRLAELTGTDRGSSSP